MMMIHRLPFEKTSMSDGSIFIPASRPMKTRLWLKKDSMFFGSRIRSQKLFLLHRFGFRIRTKNIKTIPKSHQTTHDRHINYSNPRPDARFSNIHRIEHCISHGDMSITNQVRSDDQHGSRVASE